MSSPLLTKTQLYVLVVSRVHLIKSPAVYIVFGRCSSVVSLLVVVAKANTYSYVYDWTHARPRCKPVYIYSWTAVWSNRPILIST